MDVDLNSGLCERPGVWFVGLAGTGTYHTYCSLLSDRLCRRRRRLQSTSLLKYCTIFR
jgi:hypothetical protein